MSEDLDSTEEVMARVSKTMRRAEFVKALVSLAMAQAADIETSGMTPEEKAEEMEETNRLISVAIVDLFDDNRDHRKSVQ